MEASNFGFASALPQMEKRGRDRSRARRDSAPARSRRVVHAVLTGLGPGWWPASIAQVPLSGTSGRGRFAGRSRVLTEGGDHERGVPKCPRVGAEGDLDLVSVAGGQVDERDDVRAPGGAPRRVAEARDRL